MQRNPLWIEPAIKWKLVTFHEITWKKYAVLSLVLICILQNDNFLSVALTTHLTFLVHEISVSWIFCSVKCSWESKSIQLLRKQNSRMKRAGFDPRVSDPQSITYTTTPRRICWRLFDMQVHSNNPNPK